MYFLEELFSQTVVLSNRTCLNDASRILECRRGDSSIILLLLRQPQQSDRNSSIGFLHRDIEVSERGRKKGEEESKSLSLSLSLSLILSHEEENEFPCARVRSREFLRAIIQIFRASSSFEKSITIDSSAKTRQAVIPVSASFWWFLFHRH